MANVGLQFYKLKTSLGTEQLMSPASGKSLQNLKGVVYTTCKTVTSTTGRDTEQERRYKCKETKHKREKLYSFPDL